MPIKKKRSGDYLVLVLTGDFRGGEESYTQLRRAGHRALAETAYLALDCKRITFLDSRTLGLFVEFLRAAQARGGETVLTGITERVGRWFELSGLDRIFKVLPGAAPLEALKPAAESKPRAVPDTVDIDRMVEELQEALGEADENGAPSLPGPVEERMLSEIEKLLGGGAEVQG